MLECNKVGYARISTFVDNTQDEMLSAISTLKWKAGGHLNGFILELRDDPRDELKASIEVAGDFLDGRRVVTTCGRQSDGNHAYPASGAGDLVRGPMVVLINGASASAAYAWVPPSDGRL